MTVNHFSLNLLVIYRISNTLAEIVTDQSTI